MDPSLFLDAPPEQPSRVFDLQRLIPEIRTLVWEASLPGPRVFHVRKLQCAPDTKIDASSTTFHLSHDRPVALQVCRESRATALRKGRFLDSRDLEWFNPKIDVLYFDKGFASSLDLIRQQEFISLKSWNEVRRVAFNWALIKPFGTRVFESQPEEMRAAWVAAICSFLNYMPNLRVVYYTIPMIRNKNGLLWGRELRKSRDCHAELRVPPMLRLDRPPVTHPGDSHHFNTTWLTWFSSGLENITAELGSGESVVRHATSEEEVSWSNRGPQSNNRAMPSIHGRWLIRPDALEKGDMNLFQ